MIQLQLNLVCDGIHKTLCLNSRNVEEINTVIEERVGLDASSYFLKSNGRVVESDIHLGNVVQVVPKLCGGKGGFGSMLRAIGAQIEKTTNREACRDLSGRRLRDINEEQRLKKWISQQAEREKEAEDKKKKKLQKLAVEPKHEFRDAEYDSVRSDLTEKLSDSVEQGFKATSSKRKMNEPTIPLKKKKTILDDDFSASSSENDSGAEEDCSTPVTVAASTSETAVRSLS